MNAIRPFMLFALLACTGCATLNQDFQAAKTAIGKGAVAVLKACPAALAGTAAVAAATDSSTQGGQVAQNAATVTQVTCSAAQAIRAGT